MVENLCFQYCIEVWLVFNEGNYSFAEVTDLDVDIPQEGTSRPLSHDHDFL